MLISSDAKASVKGGCEEKVEYRTEENSRLSVTDLLYKTRICAEQNRWFPTLQGMCNPGQGLTEGNITSTEVKYNTFYL